MIKALQFKRLVWLAYTIYCSGNRGITLEEIYNKWLRAEYNDYKEEYLERTFHRDRKTIEEMFDVDIICDRRTGRYSMSDKDSRDQILSEARKWLLNAFAVNYILDESRQMKHRILFENIPSGQDFLTTIIKAMRDGVSIMLTYRSFNQNTSSTFEVYPYCVKVFELRWYLVAYKPERNAMRIYALDRVEMAQPTEHSFNLPKDFDAAEYFADAFGIIIEELPVENVRVKVYGAQCNYIRKLPLHSSQSEIEKTDKYTIFEFHLRPTYDFMQELLKLGSTAEVLSPEWFRNEIISEIEQMTRRYK